MSAAAVPWAEVAAITLLTLRVAVTGTLLGALIGIPVGAWLGVREGPARGVARTVVFALYGLPPVVAGLALYLVVSASGPLGFLHLLYTPGAMILGEVILTAPLVAGLTAAAITEIPGPVREAVASAAPPPMRGARILVAEARAGVLAGVMVGFGRAVAEVAAALLLGGNIRYETRTLGTAILQEVAQGRFAFALTLGAILLALALVTVYGLHRVHAATRDAGGAAP